MADAPVDFSELTWRSQFVERMPGDPMSENYTRRVSRITHSEVNPTPVSAPKLIAWSGQLGAELGIAPATAPDTISVLAGNRILPGMRPYAYRYGGHQFGHWADQLGDGRAITLGEGMTPNAGAYEFQLKGAGPTPYSRRADGRAVLRSSVREYLCSEAMHFLGIPTTRALSLVATGDPVVRDMFYDGNPAAEPGAIVCRVARSFLRFGNFEILTAHEEPELLRILTDELLREHYPEIDSNGEDRYGLLLDEIARRTAHLVTGWMRVGFVHGVLNTDNMSALGLTIDYGPYGWLEPYDPNWTPNTTDREGRRYRFSHQPQIVFWNLTRLAEAWLPLIGSEKRAEESLGVFQKTFGDVYSSMMASKIGWTESLDQNGHGEFVGELFPLLQATDTDYTIFFRSLAQVSIDENQEDENLVRPLLDAFYDRDQFERGVRARWIAWLREYGKRSREMGVQPESRTRLMNSVNPKYVFRNYLASRAIEAATAGDYSGIDRLYRVLQSPYQDQAGMDDLATKRPDWAKTAPGCSMLSCSS